MLIQSETLLFGQCCDVCGVDVQEKHLSTHHRQRNNQRLRAAALGIAATMCTVATSRTAPWNPQRFSCEPHRAGGEDERVLRMPSQRREGEHRDTSHDQFTQHRSGGSKNIDMKKREQDDRQVNTQRHQTEGDVTTGTATRDRVHELPGRGQMTERTPAASSSMQLGVREGLAAYRLTRGFRCVVTLIVERHGAQSSRDHSIC